MELVHNKGDIYHVTGLDISDKRFKLVTDNPIHAMNINLWRGTVWQLKKGKAPRHKIKEVWN